MITGPHPFVLVAALGLLGVAVCVVAACLVPGRRARVGLVLGAMVCLLPSFLVVAVRNPELVDARFRTFKRLHAEIRVGMTRTEVMDLVGRHYPAGGVRLAPTVMADTPGRVGFFMNSEGAPEPNCEGIFMTMDGGRVVCVSYSPD